MPYRQLFAAVLLGMLVSWGMVMALPSKAWAGPPATPVEDPFIEQEFREELIGQIQSLDDILVNLKQVVKQNISEPAKWARACTLLAEEFLAQDDASRAYLAVEVALFIIQGNAVATPVFYQKCLTLQQPTPGVNLSPPPMKFQALQQHRDDGEQQFIDIINLVNDGIKQGLIKGEPQVQQMREHLGKLHENFPKIDDKVAAAQELQNKAKAKLLEALAYLRKSKADINGEANVPQAWEAVKQVERTLARIIRVEKKLLTDILDFMKEKAHFLADFLDLRDGTPPPHQIFLRAGHALHVREMRAATSAGSIGFEALGTGISSIHVRVFSLTGKAVFDSGAVSGNELRWHFASDRGRLANGVYLYQITARGTGGQTVASSVRKLLVLN